VKERTRREGKNKGKGKEGNLPPIHISGYAVDCHDWWRGRPSDDAWTWRHIGLGYGLWQSYRPLVHNCLSFNWHLGQVCTLSFHCYYVQATFGMRHKANHGVV